MISYIQTFQLYFNSINAHKNIYGISSFYYADSNGENLLKNITYSLYNLIALIGIQIDAYMVCHFI